MKALFKKVALVLSMMCVIAFASPLCLSASNLNGMNSSDSTGGSSNGSDDSALSDYMRNYNPITQENMQKANVLASPIASFLGTVTGAIMIVVGAGIFFVTACDLCYIGLPFTRSLLNPQQAGGGGMPMGGMGGMGSPMGGGAPAESGLRRKWVSDEAVAAVAMAGGGGAQGGGIPMGGGLGMGGMGMGAPMGGMPMGGGAPQSTKSVIFEYLKKRIFFIVIFAVASIVLMSSILTDCGINIAELLLKILNKFSNNIGNTQIN